MKKSILLLSALFLCVAGLFAGKAPAPENTSSQKQWLFKPLSAAEVSLEVERIDANVLLHLFSKNMKNIDMIFVEKSKNPTAGFVRCKSVKVADHLLKSKTYISVVDETPYENSGDCYYRIRTVSAAGESKVYPSIVLSAIQSIGDEVVDNGK